MPVVPEWIRQQWNFVDFLIDNPCDAPWTVYFTTAAPALGEALIVLTEFGTDDVVRGIFRPRQARMFRHFRKGARRPFPRPSIPELGEEIGKRVPGAKVAKARRVTQGVENLWLIDGALQRILFWWLILEVTENFLIQWTTNIFETRFCEGADLFAGLFEGPGVDPVAITGWVPMEMNQTIYNRGPVDFLISAGSTDALPQQITATWKGSNTSNFNHDIQIGIFRDAALTVPWDLSEVLSTGPGEPEELVVSSKVNPFANYFPGIKVSKGSSTGTESLLYAQEVRN